MRSLLTILKNIMQKLEKKTEVVKAWENASPTSTFNASDVTLPANFKTEYDFYEVEFRGAIDNEVIYTVRASLKPTAQGMQGIQVRYGTDWFIHHRSVWWNGDKIHFDNNYYENLNVDGGGGQDNRRTVPYRIYGVKGAQ